MNESASIGYGERWQALVANRSDIRLAQELLRHSSHIIALDHYTRSTRREDQSTVVGHTSAVKNKITAKAENKNEDVLHSCFYIVRALVGFAFASAAFRIYGLLLWVATHVKGKCRDG